MYMSLHLPAYSKSGYRNARGGGRRKTSRAHLALRRKRKARMILSSVSVQRWCHRRCRWGWCTARFEHCRPEFGQSFTGRSQWASKRTQYRGLFLWTSCGWWRCRQARYRLRRLMTFGTGLAQLAWLSGQLAWRSLALWKLLLLKRPRPGLSVRRTWLCGACRCYRRCCPRRCTRSPHWSW